MILILEDSVLLGGFELVYEVLDYYGVYETFLECRSDEDLILYDRQEFLVNLVMIHVELLC